MPKDNKGGFFKAISRFGKTDNKSADKESADNKSKENNVFGKAIGIDLGTTNTVFGIKKVHMQVLKNSEQEELTPSCVTRRKKQYIVGRDALAWRKQDPENTIVSIKRLIGRSSSHDEVQKIIREQKVSYTIKQLSSGTEQSIAVVLSGKEHTPEQISAEILKKIKHDAEEALGEEVSHAVITIPSYFNDKQKHATRIAAAAAGFKVQRLLPEPTAAAISFGVDQSRDKEIHTIMVYDFGGGTFDISILTMAEGQFIEQAKGGDMWLGGNDIDNLLIEHVYGLVEKEYPEIKVKELLQKIPVEKKNRFLGELHEKVERAKVELSERDTASFDILGLLKDDAGDIIDVDVEITRAEFEALISPLIERTIQLMEELIQGLHFTPDMIDKVLLVGGSSCIPLVQQKVSESFGSDKVMVHQRPLLSVSEGAAILAHRLSDNYECPECGESVNQNDHACKSCGFDLEKYLVETGVLDIVHSAAHDYYICLEDTPRYLLVAKNTPLPVEKTEIFRLVDTEQSLVHLRFFNLVNEQEESIGDLWLGIEKTKEDIQKEVEGETKREVVCHFRIDESNIIEVSAKMKDQPKIHISRTLSRGKEDEQLFLSLEEMIQDANSTKYTIYAIEDFVLRSVNIIHDINHIVDSETGQVREKEFNQAKGGLDTAEKILKGDEPPTGIMSYAELMLHNWRPYIHPEAVPQLEIKLKNLEKSNRSGRYQEIKKGMGDLSAEIKKQPIAALFMELDRVYSYYRESRNSAEAERISSHMNNMQGALENRDMKEFHRLAEEINPEIMKIREIEKWQTQRVEKGITR